MDGLLLNLFCCKAETAKTLVEQGWMVSSLESRLEAPVFDVEFFNNTFSRLAFPERVITGSTYNDIISHYLAYRDQSASKELRYAHLRAAYEKVEAALQKGESRIERMATYARVAFDYGQRAVGVQICDYVIKKYLQNRTPFKIEEAYIPISDSFERTPQKGNETAWILASFVDQYVRKHAYSCYFSNPEISSCFRVLDSLGFLLPDMAQRGKTLQTYLDNQKSSA